MATEPGLRCTSSLQYPGACWIVPASAERRPSTAAFLYRLTDRRADFRPTFFLYKRPSSAPLMSGLLGIASAANVARVAPVAFATPPEQLTCSSSTYETFHSPVLRPNVARTSDWHPPPSLLRPEQMNFFCAEPPLPILKPRPPSLNPCATLPFKLFHSGKNWPRRWCGAGGRSALMVLLCVVCGWHWRSCSSGEREIEIEREREVHTAAPKVRPHARACTHTRPRHRRGVGERPHVRGAVERTASLVVAKTRCRGGQARWPWRAEWPLQGIPSKKAASGGCGPISINHVALFGLSCTRFYPAPCFGHIPTRYTLFWPPPYCKLQERVLNAVTAVLSYTIRTYTL